MSKTQTDHVGDANKMITAVEFIEKQLTLALGDELKSLRGLFVVAKEMEKERTEELQRKINDLENMLLELGEQQ